MRGTMDPDPLLARQFPLRDGRPHGGAEHLRAAAGQAGEAGLLQGQEHLALGDLLDACQVRDLHRRQRLDVHGGVTLLQPTEHVGVVGEPQLRMEAADDVELRRRRPAGLFGLGIHLVQRPGVGPLLLRRPRERTESAGGAQDADVGGIEVLVCREEDPVAVLAAIGKVGEGPETQQVARRVERESIGVIEPLATLYFVPDRPERRVSEHGEVEGGRHAYLLERWSIT
ncbi:MAG: hypothetical protein R2910_02915 [Gemmatimonadales bacterium]